jgi:hypothetical protein
MSIVFESLRLMYVCTNQIILTSESLQYVLESVPIVDRAFVHVDYATYNLPTHMEQ